MTKKESILVTGGAGYIGSHTVLELAQQGYNPIVVDNLSNSSLESIRRIEELTDATIPFYELDVAHPESLHPIFYEHQ